MARGRDRAKERAQDDFDDVPLQEESVDESNFFTRFQVKRRPFGFESEVRAINIDVPMKDSEIDRSPESYRRPGVPRAVDLGWLVKEVIVAPQAGPWFLELVESVTARSVPDAPVRRSPLGNAPVWD